MAEADYCEMCDLPLSQCVHGRPEPTPPPAPAPAPARKAAPRKAAAPRAGTTSTRGAARVPGSRATTTARAVPRRWTQPAELRPAILAVLQDAEGPLYREQVFDRLEQRVGDALRAGDREANPQGELRWHAAARKARVELVSAGLLAQDRPGVWALTDAGRTADSADI